MNVESLQLHLLCRKLISSGGKRQKAQKIEAAEMSWFWGPRSWLSPGLGAERRVSNHCSLAFQPGLWSYSHLGLLWPDGERPVLGASDSPGPGCVREVDHGALGH